MKIISAFLASLALVVLLPRPATAQTAPPAPTLVAPANGASLAQPVALDWNAVVDPDGPIGSYTWQVGTTAAFGTIVLSGFTNNLSDAIPTVTEGKVSGLPNGTYFWRVRATQLVGGAAGSIDSAWSAVRSFTVTGLGTAPGIPAFTTPATGARFHVREFFDIRWSAVPGAQYYLLEADDEPTFSYPLTLTTTALTFGTHAQAGWGNALANVYYRVRAVSADNVRGLPSATLAVQITNAAPVPSAPTPLSPAAGATVSLPFTFDWSDTANPQVAGYDLDVDTDPAFAGSFGVLLLQGVSRSDYMLASDLPPGNYFWRVRALHGDAFGPWSAGRAITVTAAPATPPDPGLFAIIAGPGSAYGGNSTQARVLLTGPAPAGGSRVTIASDLAQAQVPGAVIVPAGRTDATVTPITTGPAPPNGVVGVIRAAYAGGSQQSSLGVLPILYGTALDHESVTGGASFTGTVTLQSAAPPGGTTARLVSSETALAHPPATVFIPAGETAATFTVTTSAVPAPVRVVIETGTDDDGYRAPQASITLMPAGSPPAAPSLSSLILDRASVAAGGTATGTVRLTAPAPAGGAVVALNGSMEGQVITPASVTVPAGSLSADFPMVAPQVVAPHWVLVQARYGTSGGAQARVLKIDPVASATPTLLAFGANGSDVIGGNSLRGTVALVVPAPAGGGTVSLTSDNPGVAQVPSVVGIAEGNSTSSFAITTSPVAVGVPVNITAAANGVSRSWFVNVAPDPNAPPLLQSVSLAPSSVAGGTSVTGTVVLRTPAPVNGTTVTLSTSNPAVARPPPIVLVPAGQSSATFSVTTFTVAANTPVSITAFLDATRSASLTVTRGTPPAGATLSAVSVAPAAITGGNSAQATVALTGAAPSGGAIVALSSSNTAVATVPSSVTIAAGATSRTFTVNSLPVTSGTAVSINATYAGVGRSAALTVNPASSGPLPAPALTSPASDARFAPGQSIAFSWSDVPAAVGYTLQIDDQDSFASPLIVDRTQTTSQFSTSTLPERKLWWRVRANDASGQAGAWSPVRRLEVKK